MSVCSAAAVCSPACRSGGADEITVLAQLKPTNRLVLVALTAVRNSAFCPRVPSFVLYWFWVASWDKYQL